MPFEKSHDFHHIHNSLIIIERITDVTERNIILNVL